MEPVPEPRSAGAPRSVLPEPTLDVSIVVPYYNPGDRLRTTVEDMVRVLAASGMTFEIITVSDGSTDGSPFTLEGFPESVVRRVSFATNVGKGHALRTGLGMGRGRYLGFIDADGDISPELLAPFVSIMESMEPDIIIGSKRHPDSSVHYPPLRRLYSWGFQHLIALLFRLHVKDTQVGIKLVDRRVIADVLPLLRESRFALDLELLVLAHRLGYTRIVEAPVRIEHRFGSTISLKAVWLLLVDTLSLFIRYSVRHEYDAALAARSGPDDDAAARPGAGLNRSCTEAESYGRAPQAPPLKRAPERPATGGRTLESNESVQAHLNGRRTEDQVPHDPTAIRNVALVGHHGAGKTTLAEALLATTGSIARRGSVEKGSTVMDFEAEEVARQLSLSTSLAPFTVNGVKVNLLDTPGYADFAGEMVTALANARRPGRRRGERHRRRAGPDRGCLAGRRPASVLPRVVVIGKLDRERADFDRTLAEIRASFGAGVAPVELPHRAGGRLPRE